MRSERELVMACREMPNVMITAKLLQKHANINHTTYHAPEPLGGMPRGAGEGWGAIW